MERKIWLDRSRAFACFLVTVGHLLMSFEDFGGQFLNGISFGTFFLQTIYHFHVYIFFFCSGYLFQSSFSKYTDNRKIFKYKLVRCLDLGIPYFVFSLITIFIKLLFSDSVNTPVEDSIFTLLFVHPVNQMWYLYAAVIIVFVTPIIKTNKSLYIVFPLVLIGKALSLIPGYSLPTAIRYLLQNQIWFYLGMIWEKKEIKIKKSLVLLATFIFYLLCTIEFIMDIDNALLETLLTSLGIISTVEIIRSFKSNKGMSFIGRYLSKYMFPIYLLHTMCAASIRIVLLKIGVSNLFIHIILGMIFSFVVPIICAIIVDHIRFLNIVFYPSKTIKEFKSKGSLIPNH